MRTEHRWNRDRFLLVGGRLDRSQIDDLLLVGKGEPAGRKPDDAEDDQDDPDQGAQSHVGRRYTENPQVRQCRQLASLDAPPRSLYLLPGPVGHPLSPGNDMALAAQKPTSTEAPAYQPFVPPSQSPAELTARALILGALLGLVFAASSVYLALKIGLTVSASIPIAVLAVAFFRTLGHSTILENNIVQTTGSAGESIAAGIVFTLPAILLMGYDLSIGKVAIVAVVGGIMGILLMIPLRRALIVKEHGRLTYPEGTACAEVLVAGEKGGLQAKRLFQAFGFAFAYKFLMSGLKAWKEYPGWVSKGYNGASISAEVSPELLGVGYIIGPRISGYLFSGGCIAYLVLIPAIKLFGSGLTKPIFAETKLIVDMSPAEVRANFVFYIGAGAVASAGIIALIRALPTIVSRVPVRLSGSARKHRRHRHARPDRYRSADLGNAGRGRGARAAAHGAATVIRQPSRRAAHRGVRVLLRCRVVTHHRRDRCQRQSDLRHDDRRAHRHDRDLPAHRVDRRGPPRRRHLHRRRDRGGGGQRRRDEPGSQDRVPGRRPPRAGSSSPSWSGQ